MHPLNGTWQANIEKSTRHANRLQTSATKNGTVLGNGSYDVSEDGQTMTATVRGIDGAGKPFEQIIVFDRRE